MMNKAIINELKKRLEGAKGKWVEELPNVLWAYCTIPRRSISKTPFFMTFEAEAMISMEVGLSSMRVACFSSDNNNAYMIKQLDLLEENQEMAKIRLADY